MYKINIKQKDIFTSKWGILLIVFLTIQHTLFAQVERNSVFMGGANIAAMGLSGLKTSAIGNEISIDGVGNLGGPKLLYSQINGSPYLSDSFQVAAIYSRENKFLGNYPVRFNLASQQFHFLNEKSQENVVPENLVGKIVLGNDQKGSSKQIFTNIITGISMNGIIVDKYVQILSDGNASLYKYVYKHVISKENSLKAEPDYYFATSVNYFIRVNDKTTYIKKLNEANIKELVPETNSRLTGRREYNFKNESEVVDYINNWNLNTTIKN